MPAWLVTFTAAEPVEPHVSVFAKRFENFRRRDAQGWEWWRSAWACHGPPDALDHGRLHLHLAVVASRMLGSRALTERAHAFGLGHVDARRIGPTPDDAQRVGGYIALNGLHFGVSHLHPGHGRLPVNPFSGSRGLH